MVVLGDRQPRMADHLSAVGAGIVGQAEDPEELAGLLAGIEGDVVLLDAQADCSGVYPIADVCATGSSQFWWERAGRRRCTSPVGRWFQRNILDAPFRPSEPSGGLFADRGRRSGCARPGLADLPDGPPGQMWEQLLSLLVMRAVSVKPVDAAPFEVGQGAVDRAAKPVGLQARRCARGGTVGCPTHGAPDVAGGDSGRGAVGPGSRTRSR